MEGEIVRLTFECRVDSQSESDWSECEAPQTLTNLTDGRHTFEVRAVDDAGNVDPSPASYAWTVVDVTPPETMVESGPPATTQGTSAVFTFSADEQASFECSLDGGAFAACTSPRQYTGLGVGPHTFEVRATDRAGHVDASPAAYLWTVEPLPDTTPPDTTIDTGPPAETPQNSATLTFSANEQGASFQCSLDGAQYGACTSPHTVSGLSVGNHQLRVRATDAAGNQDLTPATRNWRVTPPPETTILTGPGRDHRGDERELHVRGEPGRRDLRVRARPGPGLHGVRLGRDLHRAWASARTSSTSAPSARWATSSRCRPSTAGRSATRRRPS